MHERQEHHRHIPPPDPPIDKRPRRFEPIHIVLGGLVLVGILLVYMVVIARGGY